MAKDNGILGLNRWLKVLEGYGVTKQDYDVAFRRVAKNRGENPPPRDILWDLFNQIVIKLSKENATPQAFSMLYYDMALFLDEENRKESSSLLQQASKFKLLDYKRSAIVKCVEILAAPNSCESCLKQNGEKFTIEKALKDLPIPNKQCTYHLRPKRKYSFCRCTWLPIVD